ncbi:MAG TPA: DNA-binding protein YbiB [Usitatibacter sp.]
MFDARPYLKEIARGRHGARDLTRGEARLLFSAVFAGEVPDVALGALMVALRVKGESLEELAGMMDALQPHIRPLDMPVRRAIPVILPSYNGSRKLANLVPLLAMLLAREDVPVLIHGTRQEASRVGTFEILEHLGHPRAETVAEAEDLLMGRKLAAVTVGVLSPDLARVIELRNVTGVRNSAHTLAKLMLPNGVSPAAACRLVAVTHPDFLKLMRDFFISFPANAFLMRGVEGEPVVRLNSPQPMEEMRSDGATISHLIGEAEANPLLPAREADATAIWTRDVLEGRTPVPPALARQVALIVEHCRTAANAGRPPLHLVSSK